VAWAPTRQTIARCSSVSCMTLRRRSAVISPHLPMHVNQRVTNMTGPFLNLRQEEP